MSISSADLAILQARLAANRGDPPAKSDRSRDAEQEVQLQGDVEDYLVAEGIYFHHDRDRRGDKAGVPDLLICYRGQFVGVELKSRRGKIEDEQAANMAMIRKSGGRTFIARSLEEFMEKLTGGFSDGVGPQMETAGRAG